MVSPGLYHDVRVVPERQAGFQRFLIDIFRGDAVFGEFFDAVGDLFPPALPDRNNHRKAAPKDLFLVPVVQDETGHLRDLFYRGKAAGNFLFGQGVHVKGEAFDRGPVAAVGRRVRAGKDGIDLRAPPGNPGALLRICGKIGTAEHETDVAGQELDLPEKHPFIQPVEHLSYLFSREGYEDLPVPVCKGTGVTKRLPVQVKVLISLVR